MSLVTHAPSNSSPTSHAPDGARFRYVEGSPPVHFPESAEVPETQLHLELRTLLYQLLRDALGQQVTVGSDQFVYWDAEDPTQVLAPDVYVRLTPPTDLVRTWKTWERGAPEVCVEVVSESDASELAWQDKLSRYRRLGTRELLRLDPTDAERPLRIWDRVEGRLLERESTGTRAASLVLGVEWVVRPMEGLPLGLGLEKDRVPALTRAEAREAERQAGEVERQASEVERRAREAAEVRVRELEEQLVRQSRG